MRTSLFRHNKHSGQTKGCVVALSFLLLIPLARADTASLTDRLLTEIARVERDLKEAAPAAERAGAEARLRRAADAVKNRRHYLALHELSAAWRLQAAYGFSAGLMERVKTVEDFKREWTSIGEPSRPQPALGVPLAVGAIATSSEAVAPATYRASLPYAEDTSLGNGLFYLGDAHAATRFGAFCRTLNFDAAGDRPALRSIAPEMDRFELDVVKLYDKAGATARRGFIAVNVGMKVARERDAAGDHAAALLQYLLARQQLALMVTTASSAETAARLTAFSNALAGMDHSIAKLFLEMAAAGLESEDAPGPRGATAIADFVLPEYVEIVKR